MTIQDRSKSYPLVIFPSRVRKYVHLTFEHATENVSSLLGKHLDAEKIESKDKGTPSIRAQLGGLLGVIIEVDIFPEGEVTALDFHFSYRNLLLIVAVVLAAIMGLSLILSSFYPMLGSIIIFLFAYRMNCSVVSFLDTLNTALSYFEQEYTRRVLMDERKRWQQEPKDTKILYNRLYEKHTRTWGNTKVLEYKIAEYAGEGLTREEAIRKVAEEEGIN